MASINLDTSRQPATYWTTDVPDGTLGRNGDTAINETTGVRYTKADGIWTVAGAIVSATTVSGTTSTVDDATILELNNSINDLTARVDAVEVATATVMRVYETTVGDATNSTFTITHNLGRTYPANVIGWDTGTGRRVKVTYQPTDLNSGAVVFGFVPTAGQYRIELTG